MAPRRVSQSTIDRLPEVERKKVLDALLAGERLSKVAEMAGCSVPAVSVYRRRVFKPALKMAAQVQALQAVTERQPHDPIKTAEHAALTKQVLASSPLRERLEKLWSRTETALDRAETSVRVVRNPTTGELVAVGPDVAAVGPILNQAHKNCELLGKITGELESVASTNIAIQVVLPAELSGPAPSSPFDVPTIDIGSRRR